MMEYKIQIPAKSPKNGNAPVFGTVISHLKIAGLCLLWMFLNLSCTFFNSIMFTKVGWHFPILLTLSHGWICASYYLFFTKFVASTPFGRRWNFLKFETITLHYFAKFVIPTGILLCLTIVLNNTSLDLVDVATNSIIKSLNPLLVAVFGFFVLKKTEPWIIYPLFIMATFGVYLAVRPDDTTMTSAEEQENTLLGIVLSTGSLITLSMATVLQEFIMGKDNSISSHQTLHPMSLVFYTTPVEITILTTAFMAIEWPQWDERNKATLATPVLFGLIFLDATFVFFLRFVQNTTVKTTSALTLAVVSYIKFVISIIISALFFGYILNIKRICGLLLVLLASGTYSYIKQQKKKTSATK
jgi:drug/metabolite transporter (DMT)-like permease